MHRLILLLSLFISINSLAQTSEFAHRLDKANSLYATAKKAISKHDKATFLKSKEEGLKYCNVALKYAKTKAEKTSANSTKANLVALTYTEPIIVVPKSNPTWTLRWDDNSLSLLLTSDKETVRTKMVNIPSGVDADGTPVSGFMIADREVTQLLWNVVMKGPKEKKDLKPVAEVSWDDCLTFIKKLNAMTDMTFRLPEEFEWQYAALGGKSSRKYTYSGSNTISDVTWTDGKLHDVAEKKPNELGLYDMSGNVWEWTNTKMGTDRIFKGGGFYEAEYDFLYKKERPTAREHQPTSYKSSYLGLRLAVSVINN